MPVLGIVIQQHKRVLIGAEYVFHHLSAAGQRRDRTVCIPEIPAQTVSRFCGHNEAKALQGRLYLVFLGCAGDRATVPGADLNLSVCTPGDRDRPGALEIWVRVGHAAVRCAVAAVLQIRGSS